MEDFTGNESTFLYKYQWENEFQWKARRIFIEIHEEKYEDRRLASLSNAWANWRFHGCTYCGAVQSLLTELDSELPEEIHSALSKIPSHKGLNEVKFMKSSSDPRYKGGEKKHEVSCKSVVRGLTIYEPKKFLLSNPISILMESAQKSGKKIEFHDLGLKRDESNQLLHAASFSLEESIICTGMGSTKKDAKRDCASKALEILRNSVGVVVKAPPNHDVMKNIEKGELVKAAFQNANKIDEKNVGNMMLRKMGWTGSGGLSVTGIAEPVFVESVDGRKGLGHNISSSIEQNAVEEALVRFIRESKDNDMKFSNELCKDERSLIHRLCQKYGLKHRSFGKGEKRYLVVSKK